MHEKARPPFLEGWGGGGKRQWEDRKRVKGRKKTQSAGFESQQWKEWTSQVWGENNPNWGLGVTVSTSFFEKNTRCCRLERAC